MIKNLKWFLVISLVSIGSNSFGDSSIKLTDIPKVVLAPCLGESGKIADKNEKWNHLGVGLGGDSQKGPRSRLDRCLYN